MDEAVHFRYFNIKALANEIVRQLREELLKLGFDAAEVPIRRPVEAHYHLEKDPGNCEYSLVGDWVDEQGAKRGRLLFHSDGSFFVEHDVVKPHPTREHWYVEAVNAWGRDSRIKAEARLLSLPE